VKADAWAKLAETGDVPGEMPVLDDSVRVNRAARPVGMQDYDFDHINYFHDEILSHNRGWESFFRDHDIAPLEVTYERLVAEFETVALEIVDALGNSPSDVTFGERRMQKQRDGVSKRWLIRFREDLIAHEIRRRWASTRGLDLDEADPLTPSAR
jgi:LPS sulfotransferase NodH